MSLRRETTAGVSVACVTLPACLSSGVLAYGPLGPDYVSQGAAAGLYGAIAAGAVAALVASSSFVVTSPRASIALVQASLAAHFMAIAAFAGKPGLVVIAVTLAVLLAGLWQTLFGALNIGRIIKFTPHPVVAGFVNGLAVLIVIRQMADYVQIGGAAPGLRIGQPAMLAFVIALAALMVGIDQSTKRIPSALSGLLLGTLMFYAARALVPGLDLGPTLGPLPVAFPPSMPLTGLADGASRAALVAAAPDLIVVSLTFAVVATVEALLALRVAQNLADLPPHPARDLAAQGLGNCAAALTGGIAATASPNQTTTAFRAGGRTRLSGLIAAALMLVGGIGLSSALAAIPVAVLAAIILAMAIHLFDGWSFGLLREALGRRADRRGAWQNLSIVALVMLVTASVSIVAGALAGVALSCLIFIVNMSRPIVRRSYRCDGVFSKRIRSAEDGEILRRSGRRSAVLELEGVLFFGNADDLSAAIKSLLEECDLVLLDLRGISDVDVSGARILDNAVAASAKRGRMVLFCNASPLGMLPAFAGNPAMPSFPDLDSALEWMEEEALRAASGQRSRPDALPLDRLELFESFDADDFTVLLPYLVARDFSAGAIICREGEEADRMWILTKGGVSIRLQAGAAGVGRRIAGLAMGTIVGEMALIEGGRRSATAVADEDVACYELHRTAFDAIVREHPRLATKLMSNLARVMARRVRTTTDELRLVRG